MGCQFKLLVSQYLHLFFTWVSLKWKILEILGGMNESSSKRENCSDGVDKFRFLAPLEWNPQTWVCWSLHRDRRLFPGTPFVVVLGHNRWFLWPNTLIPCWITLSWFPWHSDISSRFPQWQQCQGGGRIGLSWEALHVFPTGRISCTIPQVHCLYFCYSSLSVDPLSRRTEITMKNRQSIEIFTCNKFEAMSSSIKLPLLCDYLGTVWAQKLKCWIPYSFPFFLINWLYNKQGSWNLHVEMIKVIIQLFFKTLWIVEGNSQYNIEALH